MSSLHDPLYLEFLARLRRARKQAGLRQAALGSLLGKPQAFVSKVETGERRLDLIETAKWCLALGVSVEGMLPAGLRLQDQAREPAIVLRGKAGGHKQENNRR